MSNEFNVVVKPLKVNDTKVIISHTAGMLSTECCGVIIDMARIEGDLLDVAFKDDVFSVEWNYVKDINNAISLLCLIAETYIAVEMEE